LSAPARIGHAALAAGSLAVLITAAVLTPRGEGIGTHTQLGMPPCGWMVNFQRPCMTCGMTTAFAAAADGDALASLHAQPMGALLALITATVFWLALYGAATGSRLLRSLITLAGWRAAWIMLGLLLVAWAYKWQQVAGDAAIHAP
jgi:hypothetical protein